MRVSVVVESGAVVAQMERMGEQEIPEARRELVREVVRDALQRTVLHNPVDTGRSRSAWVTSLERLDGAVPGHWRGPHPEAGAITEGAERGEVTIAETETTSEYAISNGVGYVVYLEYGTRKMAPFAMVRRSLSEARGRVAELAFRGGGAGESY